ncbi:ParB N-terminal domain-containing protein [Halocatena marina]|uniref:ParB N-terminal domain-containing protein n=1 Tax=Halocatena marina TaxID=2934937 RepID=A0ABD5YV58_9EURY
MSEETSTIAQTMQRIQTALTWPLPDNEMIEPGDRVRDRKRPHQTGTVLTVSDIPAREYYLDSLDRTVAADNPGYSGSEPVVALVWSELASLATAQPPAVYHFPAARLVAESYVRDVPPSELQPAPSHCRTFDRDNPRTLSYISKIRSLGYIESLLLARETGDGLELIEGHKRRWIAEQADLETVAVRVVDLNDWEAAVHYAEDHLGSLDEDTARRTVRVLAAQWDDRIGDIPAVSECLSDMAETA